MNTSRPYRASSQSSSQPPPKMLREHPHSPSAPALAQQPSGVGMQPATPAAQHHRELLPQTSRKHHIVHDRSLSSHARCRRGGISDIKLPAILPNSFLVIGPPPARLSASSIPLLHDYFGLRCSCGPGPCFPPTGLGIYDPEQRPRSRTVGRTAVVSSSPQASQPYVGNDRRQAAKNASNFSCETRTTCCNRLD